MSSLKNSNRFWSESRPFPSLLFWIFFWKYFLSGFICRFGEKNSVKDLFMYNFFSSSRSLKRFSPSSRGGGFLKYSPLKWDRVELIMFVWFRSSLRSISLRVRRLRSRSLIRPSWTPEVYRSCSGRAGSWRPSTIQILLNSSRYIFNIITQIYLFQVYF